MSASTIPSIRIQCPPPPVSSSSVPSSPDPSLSRSWNYHRTSVGEHLDLVAGVGGLGNDSGDTSGGGGVPITPQRKRRRAKLKQLLSRYELIPYINLHSLDELGQELRINKTEMWLDYVDAVLDLHDCTGSPGRRLLENFSACIDRLVDRLDTRQVVRLRLYMTCVERDMPKMMSNTSATTEDSLEYYYLRGMETRTYNYCSSTSLRKGLSSIVYSAESSIAANYFVDMKLYDLDNISSSSSSSSPTIPGCNSIPMMDGRDAAINIKFYGNQLYDSEPYKLARDIAIRCIHIIEQRNEQ